MAADPLASLAGIALFVAAGLGLVELFPGLRSLPLPRRCAYAYLLGVAGVAGSLYALSHFLDVPLRRPAIFIVAALPAGAGVAARWARRRTGQGGLGSAARGVLTPQPPLPSPGPPHPGRGGATIQSLEATGEREIPPSPGGGGQGVRTRGAGRPLSSRRSSTLRRLLLLALVPAIGGAISLGILADAVSEPVRDWDGRMTWCAQARYIRAEGTVDASAFLRTRWFVSHPRYPLLLPVAQVAVLEAFAAGEDEPLFRALYAAFFPALLLVLWDGARRSSGRVAASLAVLAAAAVPFFAFGGEGGAVSAYSDLPLACFFGAGLVLLLRGRPRAADGITAGLLLGAAALTKNEGTPLAWVALLAAAIPPLRLWLAGRRTGSAALRRRAQRQAMRLAAAAGVVALALALFASWRTQIPNREDEKYGEAADLADFWPEGITRLPVVGPVVLRQMFAWEHWNGFWWAAPLVLAAGWQGWRGKRRALAGPLLLALAGPLAIAWAAYTVHWEPVYLAGVTWNRLLLQAAVPFFLLLALALRPVLRRVLPPGPSLRSG